jgi:hypothetical protein
MIESADHITGLTGASPTVLLKKNGGSFGAAAGSVTEAAYGWYQIALTSADTDTLGDLDYHITAINGDPTDFSDQVTIYILGDTMPATVAGLTFSIAGQVDSNIRSVNSITVIGNGQTATPWNP